MNESMLFEFEGRGSVKLTRKGDGNLLLSMRDRNGDECWDMSMEPTDAWVLGRRLQEWGIQ